MLHLRNLWNFSETNGGNWIMFTSKPEQSYNSLSRVTQSWCIICSTWILNMWKDEWYFRWNLETFLSFIYLFRFSIYRYLLLFLECSCSRHHSNDIWTQVGATCSIFFFSRLVWPLIISLSRHQTVAFNNTLLLATKSDSFIP